MSDTSLRLYFEFLTSPPKHITPSSPGKKKLLSKINTNCKRFMFYRIGYGRLDLQKTRSIAYIQNQNTSKGKFIIRVLLTALLRRLNV